MDQLSSSAEPAKQLVTLAHDQVAGLGLEPVPTLILAAAAVVLVGLVGLVVRGGTRRPRGAHRA